MLGLCATSFVLVRLTVRGSRARVQTTAHADPAARPCGRRANAASLAGAPPLGLEESAVSTLPIPLPVPVPGRPPGDVPSGRSSRIPVSLPVMDPQQAFAELGRLVVGDTHLGPVLTRVAELTQACVPGAEEVSVTLVEADKPRTASFTGQLAATLDERQYEAGFGPCLHAAQTEQLVRIDDTTSEDVFTEFAAIAARQGVRSILSLGMPLPQRTSGAINLYRFDSGVLDPDAVQLLRVFAGYSAIALANHTLYASSVALSEQLTTAMLSREVIDLAKGILIAQLHCTAEQAFAHLAKQSQTSNRKLRDIATEIVDRAGRAAPAGAAGTGRRR